MAASMHHATSIKEKITYNQSHSERLPGMISSSQEVINLVDEQDEVATQDSLLEDETQEQLTLVGSGEFQLVGIR